MAFVLLTIGTGFLAAIIFAGDKIKNLKKEIREQEQSFLKKLKVDWKILRPLLRSDESPDEKLTSVGLLLAGRKLDVPMLKMFEDAEKQREKLRICHLRNYYAFIFLTIMTYMGAILDFLVSDRWKFVLFCLSFTKEIITVTIIAIMSFYIIIRLFLARSREENFHNLLDQIGDRI